MELGKITKDAVGALFSKRRGALSENVMQGPAFGVDTAIVQLDEQFGIAVASDPVSLIPALGLKESAWLSVVLAANDVATSGYLPEYAQFVLNLPAAITRGELEEYWGYIHEFCALWGIAITGGHTGFDRVGPTTIAGGVTMFAKVALRDAKTAAGAQPGDHLIMTKSAALSSCAILAKSFPEHCARNLGEASQKRLADTFYDTEVLREVQLLRSKPALLQRITAMHDVTEGGVLGATFEMSEASGVGIDVQESNIEIGQDQQALCRLFSIDPLRSIGAGAMLIACTQEVSADILALLNTAQIPAALIGSFNGPQGGKWVHRGGGAGAVPLHYQERDPYWEAFAGAIRNNFK